MHVSEPILPIPDGGIVIELSGDDPELRRAEQELYRQTDRACAVLAAALLDQALSELLEQFFLEGRSNAVLEDRGAGNTFSARISLSHGLGKLCTGPIN